MRTGQILALIAVVLSTAAAHAQVGKNEQKTKLYTQMFVPINLNSASRPDIMLVPGMSKKIAHEFEEYRPYKALQQFRRVIQEKAQ